MKIVLTGSLGNIGKHIVSILVRRGHSVKIISRDKSKFNSILSMCAKPAIGSIEDIGFLTETFTGADIVYLMEPPIDYFDHNVDFFTFYSNIAHNYVQAIKQSGITKVIHLSSIGAHTNIGVGMLSFHYNVEDILRQLPNEVCIKFMRPVGFYNNMLAFIPVVKNIGAIIQNYGGNEKEPWVSPMDIAEVIVEEMEKPFNKRTFRYIASDEISPNEVAQALGVAIGKPNLRWLTIPDKDFNNNLIKFGFSSQVANGITEMNASRINGALYEDYNKYKPILGKVKLAEFAKEFAKKYQGNLNNIK